MRIGRIALTVAACLAAAPASAEPYRLAPFKDDLFAYRTILDSGYGGDLLLVEYDEERDLLRRDVVKRLKVDDRFVDLATRAIEADLVVDTGDRRLRTVAVGKANGGARAIVIFLHGRGADRKAGADDWIHGGNFNRIKNLIMRNDGLYLSPDFTDFGRRGTADIKALLLYYSNLNPAAPVFLGCASWGARICWRLIDDPEVLPRLAGLLFFDTAMDEDFVRTAASLAPERRPAIQVSNNGSDIIMGHKDQLAFFKRLKAAVPDYPIRFTLFSGGYHGSSLRMTDWRQTLNWMLEVNGE